MPFKALHFHYLLLFSIQITTQRKTSVSFNLGKCNNVSPYVKLQNNTVMQPHVGLSICFWMYVLDIGVSTVCSVATVDNPQAILVQVHPRLKRIRVKVLDDESIFYYQSPRRKWVHVCIFWFRAGDMNMYVNGKLYDVDVPKDYHVRTRRSLEGQEVSVVLGETQKKFGGNEFESYKNFKGSLYDVRIFNRTLFGQNEEIARCGYITGVVIDSSNRTKWKTYCTRPGPAPPCFRR